MVRVADGVEALTKTLASGYAWIVRDKIGFLSSSFPVGLRLCKEVLPQRLILGAVSSKMRARLAVGVLVSAAAAIASAVRLPGLDGAHVQPSARVSELFEQLKDWWASQETCKLTTCLGMRFAHHVPATRPRIVEPICGLPCESCTLCWLALG